MVHPNISDIVNKRGTLKSDFDFTITLWVTILHIFKSMLKAASNILSSTIFNVDIIGVYSSIKT